MLTSEIYHREKCCRKCLQLHRKHVRINETIKALTQQKSLSATSQRASVWCEEARPMKRYSLSSLLFELLVGGHGRSVTTLMRRAV